jgi:hypothetical protein
MPTGAYSTTVTELLPILENNCINNLLFQEGALRPSQCGQKPRFYAINGLIFTGPMHCYCWSYRRAGSKQTEYCST